MAEFFDIILMGISIIMGFFVVISGILLIAMPWLWGVADMVGCKRFAGKPEYDTTAAIIHWWEVKSLFATQSKAMVKLFPWLAMDLSEDRNVTDEDGEIT